MIRNLSRMFSALGGVPAIDRVDAAIFGLHYFTHCTECGFCNDSCCSYGVGVDLPNVTRLLEHGDALEAFVGSSQATWFGTLSYDDDYPGGAFRRTVVKDNACVFLNRQGRGCMIHSYALKRGIDYHVLKPMYCALFPLTSEGSLLLPSEEVVDGTLVCLSCGPTLYRGVRAELEHYFGAAFVSELDAIEGAEAAS